MAHSTFGKILFLFLLIGFTASQFLTVATQAIALTKQTQGKSIFPPSTVISYYSIAPVLPSTTPLIDITKTDTQFSLLTVSPSFITAQLNVKKTIVKPQPTRVHFTTISEKTSSITPTPTPETNRENKPKDIIFSHSLLNSSFEEVSGDWPDHWTSDSDVVKLDKNSHGSNGTNSMRISTDGNNDVHHFTSEWFVVDSASTYTLMQYINASTLEGLQCYIDEYDAFGNWISGVFVGQLTSPMTGVSTFTYIPTTNTVRVARIQFIIPKKTVNDFYLDSVDLRN